MNARSAAIPLALHLLALAGCANTSDGTRPSILAAPAADAGETPSFGGITTGGATDAAIPADIVRPDVVTPRPDVVTPRPDVVMPRPDVVTPRPDVVVLDVPASDVIEESSPDVIELSFPDVVDAGPPEVCGNGLDDNLDGRVDEDCPSNRCPVPAAPRTTVMLAGFAAPPALTAALTTLGMRVDNRGITLANLPATTVIITQVTAAYSRPNAEALRAWVEAGGALMTLIVGIGDPEECSPSNSLLERFGLSYDCASTPPWGPITEFLPHPITAGLTPENSPFVNGREALARPGVRSDPVARIGAQVAARASTPGCGRVLVWGDEHVLLQSYGLAPQRFWERAIAWLAGGG